MYVIRRCVIIGDQTRLQCPAAAYLSYTNSSSVLKKCVLAVFLGLTRRVAKYRRSVVYSTHTHTGYVIDGFYSQPHRQSWLQVKDTER